MDFLASLIVLASSHGISEDQVHVLHNNYCQNLYWQPNAVEKLEEARCDIYEIDREIARVKLAKY